jgi:hypothetical protein
MTRQKSFKNRVRVRMDKTSERYTAARRQLLAKAEPAAAAEGAEAGVTVEPAAGVAPEPAVPAQAGATPGPAPEPEPGAPRADVPGVKRPYSDAVIRANTGRGWDEWFALLDRWGAAERPHPEIARWLGQEHEVSGWWAQGVTVAYEQARGLRAPGQRRGGLYEVNAAKTVAVPVDRLFEAFTDPALRERWLPGARFEIRTARPGRSIRANWDDGSTRLVVGFTALGDAKSQVAVTHERVPDPATAATLKAFWRERVAVLKQVLEA